MTVIMETESEREAKAEQDEEVEGAPYVSQYRNH